MGTLIETDRWQARVVSTDVGLRVSTPANPFVCRMAEVSDPYDRLFLACRALRRDEDCIEANLVVAAAQEGLKLRLCHLHIAVEEGERLWTPVMHAYGYTDLWEVEAARPWLQAIKALGEEFFATEWYDDARDACQRLLAMDPKDHLGAQDILDRIGPRLVYTA